MKRGVGHPRTVIDWKRVDEMAHAHCSLSAIARVLGYCPATLTDAIEREFKMLATDYLRERKGVGTALMREAIFNAGIRGNIIAQIFWLKNRDGWADKAVVSHEMLPPVMLKVPSGTSEKSVLMIEEFFNAVSDDNERIREESGGLSEWREADSEPGRSGKQ